MRSMLRPVIGRKTMLKTFLPGLICGLSLLVPCALRADEATATLPPPLEVPDAVAASEAEMKPYADLIIGTDALVEMVPIPGGKFTMGSPESEADRKEDEGPQREVQISPFWMGKYEVRWDEYEVFMYSLDIQRRRVNKIDPTELDKFADLITRPTKPYTDMTFGLGKIGYPAICMTQLAAKRYCEWLSAKTGRYYRLPTEAEWEYACRAGTTTAYSFGDDPSGLEEHGWYYDNGEETTHPVGKKKPNPWGLYDMHGNVAEWCVDQYEADAYAKTSPGLVVNPVVVADKLDPRAVRGGSWDDDPQMLRSAARRGSTNDWKKQDPQIPQSIWYYTDAQHLGFRIVRPLVEPTAEEKVPFNVDPKQDGPDKGRR